MNPPLVVESSAARDGRSYTHSRPVLWLSAAVKSPAPNVPNNFNYHTNVYDKIRRQQGRIRLSLVVVLVSRVLGWVEPPHHLPHKRSRRCKRTDELHPLLMPSCVFRPTSPFCWSCKWVHCQNGSTVGQWRRGIFLRGMQKVWGGETYLIPSTRSLDKTFFRQIASLATIYHTFPTTFWRYLERHRSTLFKKRDTEWGQSDDFKNVKLRLNEN